jgi:hypothetical protein
MMSGGLRSCGLAANCNAMQIIRVQEPVELVQACLRRHCRYLDFRWMPPSFRDRPEASQLIRLKVSEWPL